MRRAVPVLLVLLAFGSFTACGGSVADGAHKTLATTLAAVNAARDEFTAWDKAHQQEIVDSATSAEEAKARIAGYRMKRLPVLRAFTIAYTSIGAASAIIPLVKNGVKTETELIQRLADAAGAAITVKEAYDAIRGE